MKKLIFLLLVTFPLMAFAQTNEVMRYKVAAVSDNLWTDPKNEAEVRKQIDRITQDGFNVISIGTYKFMPAFFVDYSQTKYPEAEEFDSKRIERNINTLRENIRYAKSKGIQMVVSRSYSFYCPYQFWKAHQKELNPDNMFAPFLEKAHQNDIYTSTITSQGKGSVIPHQQWNNPVFRDFFLYSTEKMLDVLPELDGFLNAYAEAAWTLDIETVKANQWKSWKECINYEATDDNFVDYCNTLYDLLKAKRENNFFFGMRDWYVKPEVLKRLKMPKEDLVISVKYAGYDQPVLNYPPWGKDLQDAGYSVILDMLVYDAEHPHPLYWYNNEMINTIFKNIYEGGFAGIAYQDYMVKGGDSLDNPIRLLTQKTVGLAMNGKEFTTQDAVSFLQPYYGKGSEELLNSLRAVSIAQHNFIQLMPAWFWQGDGLTPGGLQAYRFWMLMDHPEAPPGMSFIRQNAVSLMEYVNAVIAGEASLKKSETIWNVNGKQTPVQMMETMKNSAEQAIDAALKARQLAPANAPYMKDIVASAYIHQQLVLRQEAFLNAALAFYESGYQYDDKYNNSKEKTNTGIDRQDDCVKYLEQVIFYDKMLAELCRKYAPRRPERRGAMDYGFEKKIAAVMGKKLTIPDVDEAQLKEISKEIE
ncbi:MAG: hypothetical protein FWD60_01210 [Candidatus Azobacteroides sp.]|nr:hypothetical protein [Candidatus Azobacteroides sp.]